MRARPASHATPWARFHLQLRAFLVLCVLGLAHGCGDPPLQAPAADAAVDAGLPFADAHSLLEAGTGSGDAAEVGATPETDATPSDTGAGDGAAAGPDSGGGRLPDGSRVCIVVNFQVVSPGYLELHREMRF